MDLLLTIGMMLLFLFIGIVLVMLSIAIVRKVLHFIIPGIDADKEVEKGNTAVASYYGGIIQAVMLTLGMIVSAALLAVIK